MQTPESEAHAERSDLGFEASKLPWLVGAGALLIYLLTLNHWVRLDSLSVVARVAGWDRTPLFQAPLHYLVTLPFHLLPETVQPLALNLFSVLLAALTLAMLARSVALLPHDRTRDERMRERAPGGLLSIPLAWVPPLLAVLVCGLQLTFWENATVGTAEMLDLCVFAWLVRALLEFRMDPRDGRLFRFALVYGLAVTNNYAMIGFFPVFLVAVVWIVGLGFFNLRFLARMALGGVLGLTGYLVLPIAMALTGQSDAGVWANLKTIWTVQKDVLVAFPRVRILLISLPALVPLLLAGVRWPSTAAGETSVAGGLLGRALFRVVYVALFAACLWVTFDPQWSPRKLGFGLALLPFYYLGTLGIGYFAGHFLLLATEAPGKSWHRGSPLDRATNKALGAAVLLILIAVPAGLCYVNYPILRASDGTLLSRLAELMAGSVPAGTSGTAYVMTDDPSETMLMEAAVRRKKLTASHVVLSSRLLPYHIYQQQLRQRYPGRWIELPGRDRLPEPIDAGLIGAVIYQLASTHAVYYVNPSFGDYFESLYLEPKGLVYQVLPAPTNSLSLPPPSAAALAENQAFWTSADVSVASLPALLKHDSFEALFLKRTYSRALTYWGVALQRVGQVEPAARYFELALQVNDKNGAAQLNRDYNQRLQAKQTGKPDLAKAPDYVGGYPIDQTLFHYGPVDEPVFCYRLAQYYAAGALYRQAYQQIERARELAGGDVPEIAKWHDYIAAWGWFALGDRARAEQLAAGLRAAYPKDDLVWELQTQMGMLTGQYAEALVSVQRQLELNPEHPKALLNLAALSIQTQAYAQALPPLEKILKKQPDHLAALMNRAIAFLQLGRLAEAQKDYEALRKVVPENQAVYYGLAEIAFRQKNAPAALAHYELYLKYAPRQTEEYTNVVRRVQELKAGGARL